ncbi:uncharacterized protein LAESUDRAFT_764853 [Laetiporus sulphureus 93-53]|uniref:Stealth protein CR3 conserved region 3 domain-containing protein n=1 Tax=Laetiporus sulphureus 93-53 TaxID=1314785 RepID=A0A165B3N9_9APHY|nr:uncharacterized protein LAESUDRAFT_764853 [Laetiporus sulphureus 93-53]KZT00163.1 hypothetical protein LAESUDRAFT_764853 [Laetiporus sulphureus 93-53]
MPTAKARKITQATAPPPPPTAPAPALLPAAGATTNGKKKKKKKIKGKGVDLSLSASAGADVYYDDDEGSDGLPPLESAPEAELAVTLSHLSHSVDGAGVDEESLVSSLPEHLRHFVRNPSLHLSSLGNAERKTQAMRAIAQQIQARRGRAQSTLSYEQTTVFATPSPLPLYKKKNKKKKRRRFGRRYRPYVAHEAKVASRALLHEMATIWPESFAASATHPFRETANGDGDVNAFFMHAHFIVERAREALLWSWVVGRVGALNGTWGEAEARCAWEEIGGTWGESDFLVETSHRDTLTRDRVERVLLQMSAAELDLVFILYVYLCLIEGAYGRPEWVSFAPEINEGHLPRCRISYEKCFAMEHPESEGEQRRASEIFTDIAFRNEACGDCASGSHGLSAFLPAADRVLPPMNNEDGEREVPYLPLVANWEDGDFSLYAVMGMKRELNARQWVLQLLQRYRYVIGNTLSLFERVSSTQGAAQVVAHIERTPHVALLCINDDAMKESLTSQVTQVLKTWFNRRWKKPAAWEQR